MVAHGISAPIKSTPFYTGSTATANVPGEFPVAIGGHSYMIEVKDYRRRTLPALRSAQDTATEPGENSLNTEGYWRRTQSDWSLGAGQAFFDNDESSRRRFWTSKGVDVWTQNALSLLPDTTLRQSSANTNLKLLVANGYFYMVDGTALKHTTTPDSPSWTTVTTTGLAAITGIATNGSTVYVSDGVKLMKTTAGAGSASDLGATTPVTLGLANGRLVGGSTYHLFEIAADGSSTTLKDHNNTSFVWNVIAGAPNGIYAAGNSGDRNETYYIGVNTSTGALLSPVHAMALPAGETLNCMTYYSGVMLLGTSAGIRVALIGSQNELAFGPVIAVTGGVKAIEAQGQFAWFTWTNYDSTSTGLGRVNLAEFTAPLVPSYASDLMATTSGTVLSACTFSSKRYFAVSGAGMYGEAATKVSSGNVISGWIRYGTIERKIVSSIDMRHDTLPSGASVTTLVTSDSGLSSGTATSSTAGTLGPPTSQTVGSFNAESFRVSTTLNRATDTSTGPMLSRWTTRALAAPFRTEEIIVPLVLHERVDNAYTGGSDTAFDPYEEFLFLKGLEGNRTVVRYQEGEASYSVYVDAIEVRPAMWMSNHSFYQGIIVVRLLTIESSN